MLKYHKINLLYFITRTGMYINPVDEKNVVSFIHGYELGTKQKCDFTQHAKLLLKNKYKVGHSSDGWSGQIERLAKKLSLSWIATFKQIALEIVADERQGGLDKAMAKILKSRIVSLIERINAVGDVWFNKSWVEEWLFLCSLRNKWLKQLWSNEEWVIIKSIGKELQSDNVFSKMDENIPTLQLVKLKNQYDKITKNNGTQSNIRPHRL